ncbi:MAG: ABC transporter ATP-binding protein/permease [Rickettsiales bacterium]|jgi:ATP-binding cassette subfamily B protein|nr:ABC transporter ATP-binding protein/permease [Rickettsiales bacterium]
MTNNKNKKTFRVLLRILKYLSKRDLFIMLLVVLVTMLSPFTTFFSAIILQKTIDNYIIPLSNNFDAVLYDGFIKSIYIFSSISFLDVIFSLVSTQLMTIVSTNIFSSVRLNLFKKIEKLPIKFFDTKKHGDVMSVYTNDVDGMRMMITNGIATIVRNTTITVLNFVLIYYYSWKLSIIVTTALFLCLTIISIITKRSKKMYRMQRKQTGKLNGYIEEIMDGQKIIKLYNCETTFSDRFDKIADKLRVIATKADSFTFKLSPTLLSVASVSQALIVMAGLFFVIKGYMALGVAVVFFQRARGLFFPINEIAHTFNFFISGIACSERIFEILDEKEDIDNGKLFLRKSDVKGIIEFKNVFFRYNKSNTILNDISFTAYPNKKMALVGSTGAGKTTVTSLINRFYDVSEGSITFDGININNIQKASLRENISVVLQDAYFFTGSVRENIRYGRLDATDEEVKQAAKMANANYFIKCLPQGYDTILTNNAENLSQGEKQLLSIARAMISNKQVLIMDEATSSVDTRTEKLIEDGLNILMEGKTTFIIAHRLSTIKNADVIMVLEKGRVIECGNHNELLKNDNGRYCQLYHGMIELD